MKIKRKLVKAAEFRDLEWLDHEPLTLAQLEGRVVLLHFWDYSYISSLRSLAYVNVWHGRYADKGLQVIAIHAPQFDFGKDEKNLRRAVDYQGLPFPVANDVNLSTWDAYANRFWPATFLIDRQGFLSDYQFGEGGYDDIETSLQELLREDRPRIVLPKLMGFLRADDADAVHRPISPSLYFGYRRARIGNAGGFRANEIVDFQLPAGLTRDIQYLEGRFRCLSDSMIFAGGQDGRVIVEYDSGDVYMIVAPPADSGVGEIFVYQDGKPVGEDGGPDITTRSDGSSVATIAHPDVFHLIHNNTCTRHRLELVIKTPGIELFCIDFLRCE